MRLTGVRATTWMMAITVVIAAIPIAGCAGWPVKVEVTPAEPIEGWPDDLAVRQSGDIYFAGQPSEEGLRYAKEKGSAPVRPDGPRLWRSCASSPRIGILPRLPRGDRRQPRCDGTRCASTGYRWSG